LKFHCQRKIFKGLRNMNYLTKIVVAEDNENLREGLMDALELEGYSVRGACNGNEAIRLYSSWEPDLMILDIMMPGKSGYDVCREIRRSDSQILIIMLTAKGEEIDKVVGLELGADDYVTKPFGLRELMARISALIRRARQTGVDDLDEETDSMEFGDITIDFSAMKADKNGVSFELSKREIELLKFFKSHEGEVLERSKILGAIWGAEHAGMTRTLDQHIAQLRKKIEDDPKEAKFLQTVYGVGYRFESE